MKHYENIQVRASISVVCNKIDNELRSKAQNLLLAAHGKIESFEAIMMDIEKMEAVVECEPVKEKLKELAKFNTLSGMLALGLLARNDDVKGNEKALQMYVSKLCEMSEENNTKTDEEVILQCLPGLISALAGDCESNALDAANKSSKRRLLYQCKIWHAILNAEPEEKLNQLCELLKQEAVCLEGLKNPVLRLFVGELIDSGLRVEKEYNRILKAIQAEVSDDLPRSSSDVDVIESGKMFGGCSLL